LIRRIARPDEGLAVDVSMNVVMLALFGGLILAGVVAIIGGLLHARRGRQFMHVERMKALELGRELPDDTETARIKAAYQVEAAKQAEEPDGLRAMAVQCYTTTGWVAGLGLLFAVGAAGVGSSSAAVSMTVAVSAGAIGVTGMICGTILAAKAPEPRETASTSAPTAPIKPRFDPEAV
jgi:hypothetical protein